MNALLLRNVIIFIFVKTFIMWLKINNHPPLRPLPPYIKKNENMGLMNGYEGKGKNSIKPYFKFIAKNKGEGHQCSTGTLSESTSY